MRDDDAHINLERTPVTLHIGEELKLDAKRPIITSGEVKLKQETAIIFTEEVQRLVSETIIIH